MMSVRLCVLTVLLAASVAAQAPPDDGDCDCIPSFARFGVGEFVIGHPRGHWSCSNTEDVELVDSCVDLDGSSIDFTMVPGQRPNITRVCEDGANSCKFQIKRVNVSLTCINGADGIITKAIPLPVGCKCGKCVKKPDCGCNATTTNYGVGEYTFGKPQQGSSCVNMEPMEDIVTRCEGEDGSYSQVTLVADQYPNITKSCADDAKVGCGFQKERKETKVLCTFEDGSSKETTKMLPVPVGCKCCGCKKGGSGGYGGRPGGNGGRPGGNGGRPGGYGGRPSGTGGRPSGTGGRPSGTGGRPSGTGARPSGSGGRPGGNRGMRRGRGG